MSAASYVFILEYIFNFVKFLFVGIRITRIIGLTGLLFDG